MGNEQNSNSDKPDKSGTLEGEWEFSDEDIIDLTDQLTGKVGNEKARATRFVERRLPKLIEGIYNLATGPDVPPKIRLDAAKYLVDRVMGRAPMYINNGGSDQAPWEKVFGEVILQEPSRRELGQ